MQQTLKHLDRFPGRTREMDRRQCLKSGHYLGWRGSWVKGTIKTGLSPGMVVFRWNQRVEEKGDEGEAILAGVLVGKLGCHASSYEYQVYPDTNKLNWKQIHRRSLVESLWLNGPGSKGEDGSQERVRNWKELTQTFMVELHHLHQVINPINERYFEGQQVLFPGAAAGFDERLDYIDRLIGLSNRNLAEGLERLATLVLKDDYQISDEPYFLAVERLQKLSEKPGCNRTAYLVAMAKVKALDTMGENRKAVQLLDRHV